MATNGLNMVSSRHLKLGYKNKCLIGYSLYFVLATVNLIMKICKRRFRIVTDKYLGFEVQIKKWYYPFWLQVGYTNTHLSIEDAKDFIEKTKKSLDFKSEVV
jgi:hypothetical protein